MVADHQLSHVYRQGCLEVISGCMFSGKTEELIRQLKRAEYAKQKYQVFKPIVDSRYGSQWVKSHSQQSVECTPVESAQAILQHLRPDTRIVGLDEAQFFAADIVEIVDTLVSRHLRVLVAGLDTDYMGRPFGPMPELLAKADIVRKQYAICMVCGETATRTQRLLASEEQFLLGASDCYEARCRHHFDPMLSHRLKTTHLEQEAHPVQ